MSDPVDTDPVDFDAPVDELLTGWGRTAPTRSPIAL